MTPKEKARELVAKMFNVDLDCKNESMCMLYPHALLCALIAVDEIMSEAKWWHDTSSYEESTDFEGGEKRLNYWQEVKSEIEKLKF
jgi:hypothetical protein